MTPAESSLQKIPMGKRCYNFDDGFLQGWQAANDYKTYQFNACTIQELITAAGIVDDDDKVYVTGADLKKYLPQILAIQADIEKCHEICTNLGVPDLNGGTASLIKRLEYIKQQYVDGDGK